jgi:hypothetical protein
MARALFLNIRLGALSVYFTLWGISSVYGSMIIHPEVGGALSQSSPNWSTYDQLDSISPRAGDDGVDRAIRAFFLFNIGTQLKSGDTATLRLSQTSAVIDPLRPDGVPLSLQFYSANALETISTENASAIWSAAPIATLSYTYPVSSDAMLFEADVTTPLSLANPSSTSPYVWISVQLSDPSSWFPAPNRNWVTFASQSTSHQITIVPEPSTYALLLLGGAASLWALKRRKS